MRPKKTTLCSVSIALSILALLTIIRSASVDSNQSPNPSGTHLAMDVTMHSVNYHASWKTLAEGSGVVSSNRFRLQSTLGQPAVGKMASTHYILQSGFWQLHSGRIYLPLVKSDWKR